ncbi:MAG: adenylate/guanylate cyclase domain-containing protein [Methylococcaceae bacterium]
MNPTIAIKKIIVEYHLLSAVIIICYLMMSLLANVFLEILPIISATGLCIVLIEILIGFIKPIGIISQQIRQIIFNFSPYVFVASVVFFIENYALNHPLSLISRSVVAILSIGAYATIAITLEIEYRCIKNNIAVRNNDPTCIVPASLKLRHFLAIILAIDLLNFVFPLLGYVDTNYYLYKSTQQIQEVLFISILITTITVYLFYLYHRNFICVLRMQVNALHRINEGHFDISIPVVSNDESALLAGYYNTMIAQLRERDHLYKTLEKSVGGNIMNKLLTIDEKTLKQGQTYNVAILFCDLRGFSSLGESSSAEEIILFLNVYFSDVSSIISQYNGIINKFMGDAVLAIFGLESQENPVENAVNAALNIVGHSGNLYMPNDLHAETGVGIDFGEVIAGTIGSEERYEYTIIGDAVNKASRLEGLSKRLDYSIILSEDAYGRLFKVTQQNFFDLGAHKVRGRNEPINVYGSARKQK